MVARPSGPGVVLAVGVFRRLMPSTRLVRGLLDSGWLGKVLSFDVEEGEVYSWPTATLGNMRRAPVGRRRPDRLRVAHDRQAAVPVPRAGRGPRIPGQRQGRGRVGLPGPPAAHTPGGRGRRAGRAEPDPEPAQLVPLPLRTGHDRAGVRGTVPGANRARWPGGARPRSAASRANTGSRATWDGQDGERILVRLVPGRSSTTGSGAIRNGGPCQLAGTPYCRPSS